jgi:hypothetical protein
MDIIARKSQKNEIMRKFLLRRLTDVVAFFILLVLIGGFAKLLHIHPSVPTGASHYIVQAKVWLQGHLDLGQHLHDSINVDGKYYLIFPPLPSLLMLPFVVILGDKFSDVWFTWIFAACNIILLFRTLEVMRVRSITNRTMLENVIISITFGFGTIALWLCLGGNVWFTGQTISVTGIMVTLYGALSRRWFLASLGVGVVMLTRTSEALIALVPLVVYLRDLGIGRRIQQKWQLLPQRWPSLRELIVALIPAAVALVILLVRNQLIFKNILSSGYDIQNQQIYPDIKNGVLSWHYLWPNFVVDFLRWPSFTFTSATDIHPQVDLIVGGIGTSMFFSTPLAALFLFAPQGKTPQNWLRITFWITLAIMLVSVLLYCWAGAYQVGARYLFGIYPLLFLLLAQREARIDVRWIGLAGAGIFINLLLARVFWYRNPTKLFIIASASAVLVACVVALILLYVERRRQQRTAKESNPSSVATEPVGELTPVN